MLIISLFTLITASLTFGTYTFEDCRERDFEPKACKVAEKLK
jgi:hypothetical protein